MDRRQRLLLEAIFGDPAPNLLPWEAVEGFLEELGCVRLRDDPGSVRFARAGVVATFQRSRRLVWPYQIGDLRDFLERAGLRP